MEFLKSPKASWIWLVIRLYVGYQWLTAGWGKLNNPQAMNGTVVLNYWKNAVKVPAAPAKPPISYDWWRSFLTGLIEGGHNTWFGPLVAIGEFMVGVALIVGFATVFAAMMGILMNWAFVMSGSASSNGLLMLLQFGIIALGGAYAGYLGVDYYIRPLYRNLMDTKVWRKKAAGSAA